MPMSAIELLIDANNHLASEREEYSERAYLNANLILSNLAVMAVDNYSRATSEVLDNGN